MPALVGHQMASNHRVDGAWCSGCGLHRHVTGQHRADCTAPVTTTATPAPVQERQSPTRFDFHCAPGFRPPAGPGRCTHCALHTPTQGHRDGCPDGRNLVT